MMTTSMVEMTTVNGGAIRLPMEEIDGFSRRIEGRMLRADHEGYDEARAIWNAMIDRRPAMIVQCRTTGDVVQCVRFAQKHGLLTAVRGGGHNIAGSAICDGGLVIDLSPMKAAKVDPGRRRVTVEPGATLGDLDTATQAYGLATPVGINSTTGIAGLTLGGGFGWLSRKYGLTIDNLLSAEVVTAGGNVVTASAAEHQDLFWAIRGGGGNFGVVTKFEFRLHPVGPEVLSGLIFYPLEEARSVLRQYRAFMAEAPDDMTVWAVLRKAPPLPFLPEEVHGKEIVALGLLYAGDPATGQKLIEPLRRFGTVAGEHVGMMPYTAWQQAMDPLLTAGARNYWKSHNFTQLPDGLLDTAVEFLRKLPTPHCEIIFAALGGATMRPAVGDTAYAHRDVRYVMNVHGRWMVAAEDETGIRWAREYFDATAPYAASGVYVNFMTEDDRSRVGSAYGTNLDRLARVKREYDPGNMFRVNQNIVPA